MIIQIGCPQCDGSFRVPEEFVGRKVRCKNCLSVFTVEIPSVEEVPNEASTTSAPRRLASGAEHPLPRSVPSVRAVPVRRSFLPVVFGGLIAFVAVLGLTVAGVLYLLSSALLYGDKPQQELVAVNQPPPQREAPQPDPLPPAQVNPPPPGRVNPWPPAQGADDDAATPPPVIRQPQVPRPLPFQRRFTPPAEAAPEQQTRETVRVPLMRPPSRSLALRAAPLPQAKSVLTLPGSVHDVCVGGGGRFLIFHLPQQRQLAVFDANEAKIVKYLSVPEDNILLAAGMTKLLVVVPDRNMVQRWDLTTFQRDVTQTLPVSGKICTAVMGSASDGALILGGPTLRQHGALPLCFIDVATLKEIQPAEQQAGGMVGTHPQYPHSMRVSADGRTITMWNVGLSPMGLQSVVVNGSSLQIHHEHTTVGEILPSPDGRTLFTAAGVYTDELKRIGDERPIGPAGGSLRLPAVQGDFSLGLDLPDLIHNRSASPSRVAVYMGRDQRPLVTLSDVDGLELAQLPLGRVRGGLSLDKRVFLIPAAKLLVTVPATADKLHLQRFDLDALEKSGIDYLYVSSQPITNGVKGKPYDYPIIVKSKKGGVTFKLESAPQGMKISKDGRLTWTVPAEFTEQEVSILVTVGDASGQEIFHTFAIAINDRGQSTAAAPPAPEPRDPLPAVTPPKPKELTRKQPVAKAPEPPVKTPGGGEPARVAVSIGVAPLRGNKEERALPAAVGDLCVGGGGRYLILHLPQQRQLAIFDANQAKIVKYLSVPGDNVKIAACADKLIVLVPEANVLQRYSLSTFEREVTVPSPVSEPVVQLLLGSASRGPLILITGGQRFTQGEYPMLDPYTFKTMPDLLPLRSVFGGAGPSVWRISANGRVITSYQPGTSPQGHLVRVCTGKEYTGHALGHDAAGHMAPGPEGRFVYTARGVYTAEGQPSGKMGSYNDGSRYCLPSAEGEGFYLCINVPGFPHGGDATAGRLYLHLTGDDRPVAELTAVEVPRGLNTWGREKFGVDKRFYLIPSAKLLVVLPETQDRLLLYRVDVDELLAKSDIDYLVVLSRPPASAVQGQTLNYVPSVKSRKGGVKVKLESGPPGMTVSGQGRVSWKVPADFAPGEVDVILGIGDASGQETFQTFRLTVREK
jgi:predicted Zn finger-like uncharacterized protein